MLSQSIFEIFRFTDVNGISPIVLFTKKKVNSCLRYVITVTGCNFNTRDFKFQLESSAVIMLSAVPFTRNNSIDFP